MTPLCDSVCDVDKMLTYAKIARRDSVFLARKSKPMTDPDVSQQLEGPLALLKSIAERALSPGQVLSQSQLQAQLAHLQSAVSEVLDIAAVSLTELLEQVEDELEIPPHRITEAREELGAIAADLEEQLGMLSDILLNARNFAELGAAREEVEGVELAMQGTLARMEFMLDSLVDSQFEEALAEESKVDEASVVLELLANALEFVDGHLADGNLDHLRDAIERVDQASQILRYVLTLAEDEAIRNAMFSVEDDEEEHTW